MKMLKKILLGIVLFVAAVAVLFVACIGPWPVYKDSKFASSSYYKKALADIDKNTALADITGTPGKLRAGWAARSITPPKGTPLNGYGDRKGAPSTGVRDELYSKAVVFGDGVDNVALVGNDILIITPNVTDLVRKKVGAQTPLTANNILFTASHSHCASGAFAPGVAGRIAGGKYDPKVAEFIANAMADAIIEAYNTMAPAKMADGAVDTPESIRNRTRDAAVDSALQYMVVEKLTGEKCHVVRFSAHPTIFGGDQRQFSAEYPGELQRAVESTTGGMCVYLGGAVGSMSPRAPEAPTDSDRVIAFGQSLARKVLESAAQITEYRTSVDVASVGMPVGMPGAQMRPVSPKWRVSPFVTKIMGVPSEGWIQGVRLGDLFFLGLPYDFSGELAKEWREEKARAGWKLWAHGFSNTYCGYLSPDRYYTELDGKQLGYEIGFMNWFGPNAEAYFKALFDRMIDKMGPPPVQAMAGTPGAA